MWCQNCGQDVPGVAAEGTSEYRCPRCRRSLRQCEHRLRIGGGDERQFVEDAADKDMAEAEAASPTPPYDGWELEQRLIHIERMLGAEGRAASADAENQAAEKSNAVLRFDSAHASRTRPHGRPRPVKLPRHGKLSSAIVWSALLIGVTTLVCGGVLMGWSMLSSRDDLWSIGFPIALVGGISLFAALIVQMDRLLNDNRDTKAKLDNQLHRLATATNQLGSHHHLSPSDAFYSHLADGANPQLLLSDLKSQLDMLAVKISDRETG